MLTTWIKLNNVWLAHKGWLVHLERAVQEHLSWLSDALLDTIAQVEQNMINSTHAQVELTRTQIQLLISHSVINVPLDISALPELTDHSSVQMVIIALKVLRIISITLVHLALISRQGGFQIHPNVEAVPKVHSARTTK